MTITYAQSGVDINKVKGAHHKISKLVKKTWGTHIVPLEMHYAGIFKVGGVQLALHTDGVGTKVLVAHAMDKYDTLGIDCIAMNVNDILCVGAKPIAFVDYIALQREDEKLIVELMRGLMKGAQISGMPIVGGETAILRDLLRGSEEKTGFDLAGTAVGIIDKRVTGAAMKKGDVVIGLESSGIHSNGYTLARRVLDVKKWGKKMLVPTRIYVQPVLELMKHVSVKGMAHITGGAYTKLRRITSRSNTGMLLNYLPKPHRIFREMMKQVEPGEMYKTFNMGIGYVLVVNPKNENYALEILRRKGARAQVIGEIIQEKKIKIESGFFRGEF